MQLNGIQRLVENIKEIMTNIIKSNATSIDKKLKLMIELSTLLLINVTQGEEGAKHFMQSDQA